MKIGKVVKITGPKKVERPVPSKVPQAIPVPNWPVKKPAEVPVPAKPK